METQTDINNLESEQETVSDDVATRSKQLVGYQPVVEIDDDPFVIADIQSSDGGWIEDLDEEVPALRKLSDGEDENFDDVDEEFNYDESFLSTTDDCAEDILGDLNNADEMATRTESTGHLEVPSSPQENAPILESNMSKVAFVENKGFPEQSKLAHNCEKENSNATFSVDNAIDRKTTLQAPKLSKEADNPSLVFRAKNVIDDLLGYKRKRSTQMVIDAQGSKDTLQGIPAKSTKNVVIGESVLPSKGIIKTRNMKTGDVVSHAFDVKGGNIRIRRRKQVLKPRESDHESDTKGEQNSDVDPSPTKPDHISPMTCASSQSEPAELPNPPIILSSSKFAIKPVEVTAKGKNAPEGLTLKTMPALLSSSLITRSEKKVESKVPARKSVDSKEKPDGRCTVRISGEDRNSAALTTPSESLGDDQKQQSNQPRVDSRSKVEDGKNSLRLVSDDNEGIKKHYSSVDEYVQELRRMMKVKGIKNMLLKGPKNVITDVTKKLNDSDAQKALFRLGCSKTSDQQGIDSPRSSLKLKKTIPVLSSPSPVDSKKEQPLIPDPSKTSSEVLVKITKVSSTKGQPLDWNIPGKGASSTPRVKYYPSKSVAKTANESKTSSATPSTDVFKALSMLKLVHPPKHSTAPSPAPVNHPRVADAKVTTTSVETTNPAAGNTVIDIIGRVIPSSCVNAPQSTDQTDSTGLRKTASGEKTKTTTDGCAKDPNANDIADSPGEGKSARITRSMSRSLTQPSPVIVKTPAGAMPPPFKMGCKSCSIVRTKDGNLAARKQGDAVAPSQTLSSTVPHGSKTSGKNDGSSATPGVPVFVVSRPTAAPPPLQPKRNDLVRYFVMCPDGQRRILQVPGGIPVQISKVLSGKPPIIENKSSPSVGVCTENSTIGKRLDDRVVVKVTTEILPSGIHLKRVTTRARSPSEHGEGTSIEPERNKTDPTEREMSRINVSSQIGKNVVSNSDGSHGFTQATAKAINQSMLPENNPTGIPRANDKTATNRVSQPSTRNYVNDTCESKEDSVNSSSPRRRSRRERKVARPYSPPPAKRRKFTSSPSSPSNGDASGKRTGNRQLPASQPSVPTTVDLKKETEVPHLSRSSDHTKSDHTKRQSSKPDAIIPPKGVKVFIKSEPLSDDELTNSAEHRPNLAECDAVKTEPDADSDLTDIPTDSDDNDDESCLQSAKPKGPFADTRSAVETYELPKVSETEHLPRAEKMRLLQQRIEEQEMMLKNIQKQRHQLVMQRKNNPYLKDLY